MQGKPPSGNVRTKSSYDLIAIVQRSSQIQIGKSGAGFEVCLLTIPDPRIPQLPAIPRLQAGEVHCCSPERRANDALERRPPGLSADAALGGGLHQCSVTL